MKTELLALIDELVKYERYVTKGKFSAAKDAKRVRADIVFLLTRSGPKLDRETLVDLIAEQLSGTYHCTRVWNAWNVGTMSQDDFEAVDESDTPGEIADSIIAKFEADPAQYVTPAEYPPLPRPAWNAKTIRATEEAFSADQMRTYYGQGRIGRAPAPAAKCETCNDNGLIGGPSFYDPGEGGVPCPDCSAPAAVEPVAYLHDDGYWTAAKTEQGRALSDRLHFAGSPKIGVHLHPAPTTKAEPAHPDDIAVDALATAMKFKLAKQRSKGYGGWDTDCTQQRLSDLLRGHVDKGDPIDVANFCAFLSARGEGIAAAPADALDAEFALRKVLSAVQRYLPPDGISIDVAMNEVIAAVDPWPIGRVKDES